MSARIAPEPVLSALKSVGDYRQRQINGEVERRTDGSSAQQSLPFGEPKKADKPEPMTFPPVEPPGAAFAVALITGQLPPRPKSERELQMRLGSADLPAQGTLALHDRLA